MRTYTEIGRKTVPAAIVDAPTYADPIAFDVAIAVVVAFDVFSRLICILMRQRRLLSAFLSVNFERGE